MRDKHWGESWGVGKQRRGFPPIFLLMSQCRWLSPQIMLPAAPSGGELTVHTGYRASQLRLHWIIPKRVTCPCVVPKKCATALKGEGQINVSRSTSGHRHLLQTQPHQEWPIYRSAVSAHSLALPLRWLGPRSRPWTAASSPLTGTMPFSVFGTRRRLPVTLSVTLPV